jgi:molybdate/tungstate transport system permease protein
VSRVNAKISPFQLILILLSGLVLLFIIGPLAGMFFSTSPSGVAEAAGDSEVLNSIGLTLWTSMAATLLFAMAAIPFAYLMARKDFPMKGLVTGIIDLPIVIPHSAAGIALLGVISRDTAIGQVGEAIGLDFVSAPAGIALAMAFVSIPFLINAARDGFAAVPLRLEQAAATLGASPARIFFTVSLPLAWRSIVSGLVLMFGRGMSEFGAVVIIAYHPMIAPVLIWDRFSAFGLQYARPVAVLFILISLAVFLIMRILAKQRKDA